ncbi:hypothetical protein [Hyphomicrobium facile]|uniref:Formate dehydrogenase F4B subunit n=1 Tax=Hyphomicrobium facile TaxID=51670 RepID=A0A1I7MTX1_9HYPH|nr:hypothetical protein [Hyphomicrobium facile]SFV25848.1 hypothetical protein SAMN04488557_0192 [Hyphomicrobium facile]
MSADREDEITEETILEAVSALRSEEAALSPLGAAILAALHFGIAKDSRTFSRKFDIAHALALREITTLSDDLGLVTVVGRNPRTQRTELALSEQGLHLFSRATET